MVVDDEAVKDAGTKSIVVGDGAFVTVLLEFAQHVE